jgi:hypothetical protein
MWQESVKNGETDTWAEFVAAVRHGNPRKPGPARRFWRHQAATPIARRWSRGVGADAVTIVTLPPAGSADDRLWQRFCTAVGLDPEPFDLTRPANESLGAASAEVMRALNERLGGALSTHDYNAVVKRLAKRGLAPRREREQPIGLRLADGPADLGADPGADLGADAWLDQRAQAMIAGLGRLGVRVVGDLGDLRPLPVTGVDPADVPPDERLAATVDALAHLLQVWPKP